MFGTATGRSSYDTKLNGREVLTSLCVWKNHDDGPEARQAKGVHLNFVYFFFRVVLLLLQGDTV